jgi:hypothetical protein
MKIAGIILSFSFICVSASAQVVKGYASFTDSDPNFSCGTAFSQAMSQVTAKIPVLKLRGYRVDRTYTASENGITSTCEILITTGVSFPSSGPSAGMVIESDASGNERGTDRAETCNRALTRLYLEAYEKLPKYETGNRSVIEVYPPSEFGVRDDYSSARKEWRCWDHRTVATCEKLSSCGIVI